MPAELGALLAANRGQIAAVIVEPLVQGAAGMLMQPPGYLARVRELCDAHDVLLICDEVATGFGRTGTMFACEQESVTPDLLCVGKGLTGGYLALSATLTSEPCTRGSWGRRKRRGRSSTATPTPAIRSRARPRIATLEVFERERTLERLQPKVELLERLLAQRVTGLPGVVEVRQRGFMVGVELIKRPAAERLGHNVALAARRRGAVIRPLGDVVVLMPPLTISEADLRRLVAITAASIAETTAGRLRAAA